MYFDSEHTCLREFANGTWLVDLEQGYCFQPLIFYYIDQCRAADIQPFRFDWLVWRNQHFCYGFGESVTSELEPAGDYSEDLESVTEPERQCVICGRDMTDKRGHALTCSPKCRKALSRKKS